MPKLQSLAVKLDQGPVYAALTYGHYRNHETVNGQIRDKVRGLEVYGSYRLDENFKVETGYVELKDKSSENKTNGRTSYFPVGLVYTTGPVQLSGTYTFENSRSGRTVGRS